MQFRTFAIAAALAAAPLTGASAEPQILGLLAQSEPLTLNCSGGECFAEFSSFCMEPDRDSPSHETAYQPFDEADLTLVASTPTGEKRLSARDLASFVSVRGYAAVRVSVPETVLADLGASSVALAVGRHVALMPTADPKYRRPHESQEIALAKGPRRLAGERIVDQGGDKAAAARVLGRLINGLPERGPINPAAREALWDQRIEVAGLPESVKAGVSTARRDYRSCLGQDPEETGFSMRQCLEHRHDYLIWRLNSQYWASVGGS
jgi:hypothetical protein